VYAFEVMFDDDVQKIKLEVFLLILIESQHLELSHIGKFWIKI